MSGEVVGFGVRRKGTAAIVGIVPEKIAATPPKSDSYLRDFEEVPLVLATDYAALQAKLDAVTKDAERYRFLRESGLEIAWNAQVSYSPGYEDGDAEQMDLAIDAAIDRTRSRHITEHQE